MIVIGDLVIELQPASEFGGLWVPGECCVICIAYGNDSSGFENSTELFQSTYWFLEMLKHLMCIDHIKRVVWKFELIDITHLEREIRIGICTEISLGFLNNLCRGVNPNNFSIRDQSSESRCDISRTTTRVKKQRVIL